MRLRHWLYSALIGIGAGLLCTLIALTAHTNAGDFSTSLQMARDLWHGRDAYAYPIAPDVVSYPLPAGIVALPFAALPNEMAGGLFFGLSSGLLAWCLLRTGEAWRLMVFLSWPFLYGMLFVQWPPLLVCLWFLAPLLPVVLIKPHIALPLALTGKISRTGVGLAILLGVISLVLYPTWPWVWLHRIQTYQGLRPPLFILPIGPMLLLALRRWRDRRAWLVILMSAMPQRVVYDQLALLLVPSSLRELLALVICSWLSLPVLLIADGWMQMPGGWQLWILLTLYLPALVILLRPDIETLIGRYFRRLAPNWLTNLHCRAGLVGVTGQLDVAITGHSSPAGFTSDTDSTLPVDD
jgi:hypothetical protein